MAFLSIVSKSAVMLFITALCCLFVMQLQASALADCKMGSGCFYVKATLHEVHSRKLLEGMKGHEMVFKSGGMAGSASGGKGMKVGAGWELREAPMGPDPLHHHGGGPKNAKTP
ncbi:uncharacterized protein [Coffea arabica]|uniref:Uncharacterized protein isoform X1 n=1 Tax=Coffea arabica TaxID=13443 RepID=A0A6P6WBI4_COFAR|nr:uncharacterized protein LOC113731465 [Coffea arabica]